MVVYEKLNSDKVSSATDAQTDVLAILFLHHKFTSMKVKETNVIDLLRDKMRLISVHSLQFSTGVK